MQPTIKELEEKYNKMRDDQILDLLEDEGMREDAIAVLKKIKKKRGLEKMKKNSEPTNENPQKIKNGKRIGREEYIPYVGIFYIFIYITSILPDSLMDSLFVGILMLCSFIILLFLTIKFGNYRCHDIGFSGWYQIIAFLPITFILMVVPGNKGPNKYGNPPIKEES